MIDTKHLLKVTSAWVSVAYSVCYAGVAIYPPVRDLFMQYALHTKTTFPSDYFGLGYFISGLIIWNVVALLAAALFAYLFNTMKK
jgi:hypothetical protein